MTPEPWPETDPAAELAGLRVVDLSQQLPGPYATFLLAELGASVLKIEPPGGDVGRSVDPAMFERVNARKRTLALDLKSERGRAELYALVADAHVLLESGRPGVAARLGADPVTLAAINPRLLYCSLSGYGQEGPLAAHGAHDLNIQAVAGALGPEGPAIDRVGVAWVDFAAGSTAALAITAAWHAGRSGWIDVAMLDVAAAWASIKPEALTAVEPVYRTVVTGDGERFAIAILEDAVWHRLCAAFGWDDWDRDFGLDSPAGRRAAAARIAARLDEHVGRLDGAALRALAEAADLPVSPLDPADPVSAEQRALREERGPRPHVPVPRPWTDPAVAPRHPVRSSS